MTRAEMIDALDMMCENYTNCSGNLNGDCPLYHEDKVCPLVIEHTLSDADVAEVYTTAFNRPPITLIQSGTPTVNNPVTHPSHYTQGNIQCIDAMESAFGKEALATWCKLNAFKYIWRADHKNGKEDIDKSIWYLNKYKELTVE